MADTAAKSPVVTNARAVWRDGLRFEAGATAADRMHAVDGDAKVGASPVEAFLGALAACSGTDVVDFLEKRRTPISRMEVDVAATRRGDHPRRVMQLELTFTIEGTNVEREQAERAIRLSFERYCTVGASLAGDIGLTTVLVLNGARGEPRKQAMFSATFRGDG
jgi:putative redox protein